MKKNIVRLVVVVALAGLAAPGCYMYHEREKVLIDGIDVDQTLDVAELEMQKNAFTTVLTLWAVRDQIFTAPQAARVSALYLVHIDRIDSEEQKAREFSVWHLTWAVSNIYRLGDDGVRAALQPAYDDAKRRVEELDKRIATKVFHEEELYMGDAHGGGRAYARKHLVVPGNDRYLQSVDEYEHDD